METAPPYSLTSDEGYRVTATATLRSVVKSQLRGFADVISTCRRRVGSLGLSPRLATPQSNSPGALRTALSLFARSLRSLL